MRKLESIDSLTQVAEIEIKYKNRKRGVTKITKSIDAANTFRRIWYDDMEVRERFYVMYLNRANNVMGIQELSSGGVSGTVVDSKLIFATALKMLASGIILAHNHPSDNLKPSAEDLRITETVKTGAKTLDIAVLDHIVLTRDEHYSFADESIL
jgi:DNA repair protein RadC